MKMGIIVFLKKLRTEGSREWQRKTLQSLPTKDTTIYNHIQNNSHWRRPTNQINRHSKIRDNTKTGRKCRGMFSMGKKPHLRHSTPELGGISKVQNFFLRRERFELHIIHPNFYTLHRKTSSQNIWLWKLTESTSRKTIELQRKENPLLKNLYANSVDPETSWKNPYQKAHRP